MLDFLKMFFTNLHELPESLRYGFVVLFFSSAIITAIAFKRWLEARRVDKTTDFWIHVPVSMAVVQVLLWGGWASAGFYTTYVEEPHGGKPPSAHAAHHTGAASAGPIAASAAMAWKLHHAHHSSQARAHGPGKWVPATLETTENAAGAQVGSAPVGIGAGDGLTSAQVDSPLAAPPARAQARSGTTDPVTIESAAPVIHRPVQGRRIATPTRPPLMTSRLVVPEANARGGGAVRTRTSASPPSSPPTATAVR